MIIYNKYQINEATRSELMDQVEKAQAQYQDLQDEVEEMTDKADKEYRKYRDEINFGQRNQFKAHEEIEALEDCLAATKIELVEEIRSNNISWKNANDEIEALKTELAYSDERSAYWFEGWTAHRKELKKANR